MLRRCWQQAPGSLAALQRAATDQLAATSSQFQDPSSRWRQTLHHQQEFATVPGPRPAPAPAADAATQPETSGRRTPAAPQVQKHVLYKGRWITPFRLLVRGKIFQLFGIAGVTMAVATLINSDDITAMEAFWLAALGLGAAGGSACLWYYSRRYVGELSLLMPQARCVRFSTLDFWGNRQDTDVEVERIRPPFKNLSEAAVRKLTRSPLFPVDVEGDRQYYMSVHSAQIFDKETLMKLLEGTYDRARSKPAGLAETGRADSGS